MKSGELRMNFVSARRGRDKVLRNKVLIDEYFTMLQALTMVFRSHEIRTQPSLYTSRYERCFSLLRLCTSSPTQYSLSRPLAK